MDDENLDPNIMNEINADRLEPDMDSEIPVDIIYEGEEGYETPEVAKAPKEKEPVADVEAEEEEENNEEAESKGKAKKPRLPASKRINDLSRKYYSEARRAEKAESELQKIREENDRLKRLNENQNKSVLNSQESMINSAILHAKQLQAKAIEEGDVQAQIDAAEGLAAAVADQRRLSEIKMHQKLMDEDRQLQEKDRSPRAKPEPVYEPEESEATPEALEWVSENTWFDESKDDFDPDLHQKAYAYAQYLDRDYARKGKSERIGSYEYFDDLDRYMNRHLHSVPQNAPKQGGLVMQRPKAPVAGVNRNAPNSSGQREKFMMSQEEQSMARAHGWTDQQWFQYKREAEKREKEGRLTLRNNGGL